MRRITMSRHNLLILLGFLIPTLANSKSHSLPNELFHEEFEFQRTSANLQPSAIDRRDAVRLDAEPPSAPPRDPFQESFRNPNSYRSHPSNPSLTTRRPSTAPKVASRFRKRMGHLSDPEVGEEDHSYLKRKGSRHGDFSGISVEINPKDLIYESERIKKRRKKKNAKNDFEAKKRIPSKYVHIKRSGDIAPPFPEGIGNGSENNSHSEEMMSIKPTNNQNSATSERLNQDLQNRNWESKQFEKIQQSENKAKLDRTDQIKEKEKPSEQNKKKRKKVLRVRNRQKNNVTNTDGFNLNASYDSLKKEVNKLQASPVFYENRAVDAISNRNGTENKFKVQAKNVKNIPKDISISPNRTSQRIWKEKSSSRKSTHTADDSLGDQNKPFKMIPESDYDFLKNPTLSKTEKENQPKKINKNGKTPENKASNVSKNPSSKTSQRVWKESYSTVPFQEDNKSLKHEYPKGKSDNQSPNPQHPPSTPSNQSLNMELEREEYLRYPVDYSDEVLESEYEYNKDTANTGKRKDKTTTTMPMKHAFNQGQEQEDYKMSSFYKVGNESLYPDENEKERHKPEDHSKPKWIPMLKARNFSNDDEYYLTSYNYKGDEKDQPKDVIKLSRDGVSKASPKKAQDFPDKKASTKRQKINASKDKKKVSPEKVPPTENLDFSKRFKVLKNSDEEKEYDKEISKVTNYEHDNRSRRLNKASPVSFKKKTKKQPVEAVWEPAKPVEKSKNEKLQSSRSKSRSHILNESGYLDINDYISPYPNIEDHVVDKFPKTSHDHSDKSITKDTLVKSTFEARPKTHHNKFQNENGKYFMTMFKRVGDVSLEHFDGDGSKTTKGDGYLSSIKLSWNDDDTRAHVETSVDSRRQPFLFNRHNNNEYFNTEQNSLLSERTEKNERPFQFNRNEEIARVPSRNNPPKSSSIGGSSKQNLNTARHKRSTDEDNKHFFTSHFTLGKSGPLPFSVSSTETEPFNKLNESKGVKKTSGIRSTVAPNLFRSSRLQETKLQSESKIYKQQSNPEVRSYYMKPVDSKGIEQFTKDFHAKEISFPFDSYEKPSRDIKTVEMFESYQKPTEISKRKPKLTFNRSKTREKGNIQILPRATNIQTVKHSSANSSKPFFYHSFRSIPSEPKISKSSLKLKPSFRAETDNQKTETAHLDGTENVPIYEKVNKTIKVLSKPKQENFQERPSKPHEKIGLSSISRYQRHPPSNKKVEPQGENSEMKDKNFRKVRTTTDSTISDLDLEKLAESQLYMSEDYDAPANYQYSDRQNSDRAHNKPNKAKSPSFYEKDTWGYDFTTPEPRTNHPNYHTIPETHFQCKGAGYYADPEAGCQVFHMCQESGKKHSFLCPNNTLFNQQLLVCDWQNKVNCENSESHYNVNDRIYSKETKDNDDDYEPAKWNTWSYTNDNEFPKRNDITSRNTNRVNEPETRFAYNAFSKRKENKSEHEDKARNAIKPGLSEGRSSVPITKPSFESSTKTSRTSEVPTQNSKDRSTYNFFKTTLKPTYRTKIAGSPAASRKQNLTRSYSTPREYDYFKEQGYSIIHDIPQARNQDQSNTPRNSKHPENNDKKSNWESSKLKHSGQELTSTTDSFDEFNEVSSTISPEIFAKTLPSRLYTPSPNKKTSHGSKSNFNATRQKTYVSSVNSDLWPQARHRDVSTFRIAKTKGNSTKRAKSNMKLTEFQKQDEKSNPLTPVQTKDRAHIVQKKHPRFDSKTLDRKKTRNSEDTREKKRRIFKFGNSPHTGVSRKQNMNESLEYPRYKSNVSNPDKKVIYEQPKDSLYKYPLTVPPRETGPSKDGIYGDRIENHKNLRTENKKNSQVDQEKSKRDTGYRNKIKSVTPPKLNITSRIMDIMSGITNIGSDVSKILDGKDHLYKNIQVHKLVPTKSPKVHSNSKSPTPVRNINSTKSSKNGNKQESRGEKIEKLAPSIDVSPKSFNIEMYPKQNYKNVILDNIQAKISHITHSTTSDTNKKTSNPDTTSRSKSETNSKRSALKKDGSLEENLNNKDQFAKIIKETPNREYYGTSYNQNDKLNINDKPEEIEKQIKNPVESFQYFNLNPTEVQPELKSHRLSEPLDIETASESRESLKEVRYIPAPLTTTEILNPNTETKERGRQKYAEEPNINTERFSFNKIQSPSDIEHVMIPKNIFRAALAGKDVPRKVIISEEIPDKKTTESISQSLKRNLSQNVHTIVNVTADNIRKNKPNKTERFLPGSRNSHSYINIPRRIIQSNRNSVRHQIQDGTEHAQPLIPSKEKLPSFIFTINPYTQKSLVSKHRNTEQKPYLLVDRPGPAPNLQHSSNDNSDFKHVPGEHDTNANNDNLDEECEDASENHNDDIQEPSGKPKLYHDGRTVIKHTADDSLREGKHQRCRNKIKTNLSQRKVPGEKASKEVPRVQSFPNRAALVDSFVALPKIPSYQSLAEFEQNSPHARSISKISDVLRERGQLPPKPIKLFEGHEFLRPVISTEFVSKNARVPVYYRNREFESSEESSKDSGKSSEEQNDANRNHKYAHLEKVAEQKAEKMIKSKSSSD